MESFAAPETFAISATALSGKRRLGARGGEAGIAADGAFRFFAQRPFSVGAVCPVDLPTHLVPVAAPVAATAKSASPSRRAGKERDA